MGKYPQLGGTAWFHEKMDEQFSACAVSRVPITIIGGGSPFTPSVNNFSRDVAFRDLENHVPEHTELVANYFNVRQDDAIPDLHAAVHASISESQAQLLDANATSITEDEEGNTAVRALLATRFLSPIENGVKTPSKDNTAYKRECREKCLDACAKLLLINLRQEDEKKGRAFELTKNWLAEQLARQRARCWHTRCVLGLSGWRTISLERLDDKIGHTKDNTVLIVRLAQSAAGHTRGKSGWTRKMWLQMLLTRARNPVELARKPLRPGEPPAIEGQAKANAEAELAALKEAAGTHC
jgi:hypothetical protein